jgi:ubiquinone/menaquinone biosynthesis C-methylase UbiE
LLSDARSIALETESIDLVYCISVLEHIPDFHAVIAEVRRVLRPGGIFVLTFDVDLRGNFELGPASYARLMDALNNSFFPVYPEKIIHPLQVLTSDNSIYPMYIHRPILDHPTVTPLRHCLHSAYTRLRGRPLLPGRLLVSTYGACLRKQ